MEVAFEDRFLTPQTPFGMTELLVFRQSHKLRACTSQLALWETHKLATVNQVQWRS
jgi:hypothetical protein